jgi:DNA-binding transcriptional MerR regulator
LLKIGEFAQLGNVSIRALRFYHEAGLLEPCYIDPSTHYRSYEPKQLQDLQDIRLYKAMKFSLGDIRELLRERPSAAERERILRERGALLKQRIAEDVESLARVESELQTAHKDAHEGWRIELRETQPVWVASLREKIRSYEEADRLFAQIERGIGSEFLMGKRAALWHTCVSDGPQIDCEALRFLKRPASLPRGIRVYQMPVLRVASFLHSGSDESIPQAYQVLYAWLRRNRLVSRGPKCEIYWNEPPKEKAAESLTEIRLPVVACGRRREGEATLRGAPACV